MVNNRVCFELPDEVLAHWNSSDLDAGLPKGLLRRSFSEVRSLIGVVPQTGVLGNPIAAKLPSAGLHAVTANLHDCLGYG
ncbi:MAG: hypothetical protein M3010_02945, partial [Candidatus Dormibacteraeota bacterium]|nr:hypothetical protein [Candidatus Dormibacteraeota bacterium]